MPENYKYFREGQEVCSKCHENFMNCKCTQFYPNIQGEYLTPYDEFTFSLPELRAIYKLIEHQFIPYDNEEGLRVIAKIVKILKENEQ